MSIDMYDEKVADAAQLIRDLTGGKEWFHEFDRNTQHTLELFIEAMDKVKADILDSLPSTALQAPVREVPGWQPIETAPKDGSEILLWLPAPYNRIAKARWFDLWENWQEGEFPSYCDEYCGIGSALPTLYQPLPADPVQEPKP